MASLAQWLSDLATRIGAEIKAVRASLANYVTTSAFTTALTGKANVDSPALTGVPKAPTPTAGTNNTQIATTAFVATGLNLKANLTGAAFTGAITAPNHLTTFSTFCSGKPSASEVIGGQIFPVATTIVQANCRAVATVAATASTVFTIRKDAVNLGTITFAAGATLGTISITSGTVAALQNVTITAPATPDATLANLTFLVRA